MNKHYQKYFHPTENENRLLFIECVSATFQLSVSDMNHAFESYICGEKKQSFN